MTLLTTDSRVARWRSPLILAGLTVAYVLTFIPIYHLAGAMTSALVILPVTLAGWILGLRGSLFAGFSGVLLNKLMQYGVGSPEWANVADRWPGILAVIGIGVAGGWGRTIYERMKTQTLELARQRKALEAQIAERERAEQALLEEKQRLQILYELSHPAASLLSPHEVASHALEQLCTAFQAVSGYVYIMQPGTDRLMCLAWLNTDRSPDDEWDRPIDIDLGQGVVGWVAATQQAAIVPDVRQDRRWIVVSGWDEGIRSIASLPLIFGNKLLGVLSLNSDRLAAFHDAQLPLFTSAVTPVAAALKTAHDIEVIHEKESQYRGLVENINDALFMLDMEGQITYISPVIERLFQYTVQDCLGQPFTRFVHPEDLAGVRTSFQHTLAGHLAPCEFRALDKDGAVRHVRTSSRPRMEAGQPAGITGLLTDITTLKELEAQFLQAQKLESVGLLAGGVAHDFNNLLTVILGHEAMLEMESDLSDQIRNALEEIKQAGERAATLTRQLLAFSRKQSMNPRTVNLNTIVSGLERMIQRLIGERIDFRFKPDPALGTVKVDPGQFEQVLMNLAINARDAMPEGGSLTIETANVEIEASSAHASPDVPEGAYVQLTVCDSGHGMDADIKARIFEPFFTTKASGKGTGLGLSAVYGIVQQSDGVIQVESAPGQGTSFRIYLPRVTGAVSSSVPLEEIEGFPRGTETVLLAEDENAVRTMAARILRLQGYTVLEAADGKEALRLAQQRPGQPVHLLITDIVMPHMDGPELKDHLLAIYPDMRTLYISGYSMRGGNIVIPPDDEMPLLRKPFSIRTLAHTVREVLDTGLVSVSE